MLHRISTHADIRHGVLLLVFVCVLGSGLNAQTQTQNQSQTEAQTIPLVKIKPLAHQPEDNPPKAQVLGPGQPAPALGSTLDWVKGKPVEKFERGHIYAIEFWATWCGPCIAGIPHLTEVQHRFKEDLTVIGVTAEDPNNSRMIVADFVAGKGDVMGYRVAFDQNRKTWNAFMTAAQQNGIPTAFVIDKQGMLVWLGHPADPAFETTLEALVEGTFDLEEAKKQWKKQAEQAQQAAQNAQKSRQIIVRLNAAWDAGEQQDALKLADEVVALDPEKMATWALWKYQALASVMHDPKLAHAYALSLLETTYADEPQILLRLCDAAVDSLDDAQIDLELGLTLAKRAVDLTHEEDGPALATLAKVYLAKKSYTKAIATMQRAVDVASSPNRRAYFANELEWYKAEQEMEGGG